MTATTTETTSTCNHLPMTRKEFWNTRANSGLVCPYCRETVLVRGSLDFRGPNQFDYAFPERMAKLDADNARWHRHDVHEIDEGRSWLKPNGL